MVKRNGVYKMKEEKWYKSDNGYTGHLIEGNFLGMKHWDFTIFKDGKMKFHAALKKPYSDEELKEQVDGFPEFLEQLCALRRKGD